MLHDHRMPVRMAIVNQPASPKAASAPPTLPDAAGPIPVILRFAAAAQHPSRHDACACRKVCNVVL
jgi:hypothetical protein